jgi:hypothetical protein
VLDLRVEEQQNTLGEFPRYSKERRTMKASTQLNRMAALTTLTLGLPLAANAGMRCDPYDFENDRPIVGLNLGLTSTTRFVDLVESDEELPLNAQLVDQGRSYAIHFLPAPYGDQQGAPIHYYGGAYWLQVNIDYGPQAQSIIVRRNQGSVEAPNWRELGELRCLDQ